MKRFASLWLALALMVSLSACGGTGQEPQESGSPKPSQTIPESAAEPESTVLPTPTPEQVSQEKTEQEEPEVSEAKKIRFLVDGQEILVTLEDHPAADALYTRLPMELTFEDFNGTEKIAYPDEGLPTEGAPTQCDPDAGSFCYYIPWGNFCFFYRDFRASESLMPLGKVESGLEFLESLNTADTVTVEAVE